VTRPVATVLAAFRERTPTLLGIAVLFCVGVAAATTFAADQSTGTVTACATATAPGTTVAAHTIADNGSALGIIPAVTVPNAVATNCETVTYTIPELTTATTATTGITVPISGTLTWAPPGYPSYAGYVTVNVPTSGGAVHLSDSTDYRLALPPGGTTSGVEIDGGRNVVVIGGTVSVNSNFNPGGDDYAFKVTSDSGTVDGRIVHIEGVRARGPYLGDFLQSQEPTSFSTGHTIIQVENVYCDKLIGTESGIHPDLFGAWGGHKELRADNVTAYSQLQGLFLEIASGYPGPTTNYRMRRVNVRDADGVSQFQWWATNQSGRVQHVYVDRVYLERPGATLANIAWPTPSDSTVSRRPVYGTDSEGAFATWPNMLYAGDGTRTVANWDNTADGKVRLGVPPSGNFVSPTSVGEGYVSPGYGPPG
jgi:hypothetical protein